MITLITVALVVLLGLVGYATGGTFASAATASATARTGRTANETGVAMSKSDQSLTGAYITPDPATWPGPVVGYASPSLWNICAAVALAEGFDQGPGAAPYDLNNPGDLSPGDEAGQATAGPPQRHDGSDVIIFATCEDGFRALYRKFDRIVTGQSAVYPATYTWAQVAAKYAGDSANWLRNVTTYLGVDPGSRPADYQAT